MALFNGYSISTDQGGLWFGSGFIKKVNLGKSLNLNFDFFSIYIQSKEVDLGGWLMFRSGIELEYKIGKLWNMSIAYDHSLVAIFGSITWTRNNQV